MKYIPLKKILTLSLGLSVAALLPQVAQSQNVNVQFESAGDLSSFNQVTGADAVSTDMTFSSAGGTGGSGGLIHSVSGAVDATAIYTPTSFDLSSGAAVTLSIDFLTGAGAPFAGSANAVVMLGLVGNTTTGFYSVNNATTGDNFVGGRIRHSGGTPGINGLQSQTKLLNSAGTSSPADGSQLGMTFAANEWYRLTLSVTRTATANTFAYDLNLTDIGATGTSAPTTMANGDLSGNLVNADLYNDSTAYAAFRGVNIASGNWDVAFDNFTVTVVPVPEPASMSLAALGGLGMLLFARKQKR